MERRLGTWVARADFVDYLEGYAGGLGVPVEFGVHVERIDRAERGWLLQTEGGSLRADAVVVATGLNARACLPPWAVGDELVTAAGDYRDASPYRGRDVLVVGGGSTAHDLALDLVRGGAGRVRLSVRTPPLLAPRRVLGVSGSVLSVLVKHGPPVPAGVLDLLSLGLHRWCFPDADRLLGRPPAGMAAALRERGHGLTVDNGILEAVRRGEVEVVAAVLGVRDADVALADGALVRPDAVLVATGRRPGLEPMLGHLGVLGRDGRPRVHGARTLPHAPGLYFLGFRLPAGQLPDLRFDAPAIARRVARPRRTPRGRQAPQPPVAWTRTPGSVIPAAGSASP
jgi:cation diffusion facilitator CzcD-associated flavoprotein CzcO